LEKTLGRVRRAHIGCASDLRLNATLISRSSGIGRAADAACVQWSYLPLEMRLVRRLAALDPVITDVVFAVALAAIAQLEVWSGGAGSPTLRAFVALLMTLPLALRRRLPLPVLVLVMGAALAQSVVDPNADVAGVLIVAIITAGYSVAAQSDAQPAVAGGVAGIAGLWASVHLQGGGAGNYIFAGAIFAGAWLAGFLLRLRRLRTDALQERTVALEQEQEARARAAVAEERARIARDLHDAVAHSMSVIVVQAGAERLALPEQAGSTREVLRSIEETSRQALVEMRRLVEMLRKDDEELALAPQPSLAHLELLAQQVREAGLPVDLRIEGDPRALPPGVDLSAYRIVQEALTNALKHAGPARARVTVTYAPDQLELEICDDGSGASTRADGGGHGLVGMRERVAVFGGVLEANRRLEGGYQLRATLPLARAAE
jgi:signal transduction histidine kinase